MATPSVAGAQSFSEENNAALASGGAKTEVGDISLEGLPKQDRKTLAETREYIEELIAWRERPVEEDDLPDAAEPIDEPPQGQGTVVEEMVTCGDESCACMTDGEKHGPYLYRYSREGGTLTSEYLGKP